MILPPNRIAESMPPLLMRYQRLARFALAAYWLAMFIGTHIPGQFNPEFTWPDKFVHCGAYAGLVFLARWAFLGRDWSNWGRWTLLLATYGAIDEITQIPVNRTCDPFDWTADVVGLLLGNAVFAFVVARLLQNCSAKPSA
jgi:VanZ family protein